MEKASHRLFLIDVLARIWPEERVVMGMRVCHWLRNELPLHVDGVVFQSECFRLRLSGKAPLQNGEDCDRVVEGLCRFRQHRQRVKLRMALGIGGTAIPAEIMMESPLLQALQGNLKDTLVELYLTGNDIGHGQPWVSRWDTGLSGRVFEDEFFEALSSCRVLKNLQLSGSWFQFGGKFATQLSKCITLSQIAVHSPHMRSSGLEQFCTAFPRLPCLQHLDFAECEISDPGMAMLGQALQHCPQLTHLRLSKNAFSGRGFRVFANLLPKTDLTHFDVSENPGIGADGAVSLGLVLQKSAKLSFLGASDCRLEHGFVSLLHEMWMALWQLPPRCLSTVNLRNNGIGPQGASTVAAMLQDCAHLQQLDLSSNMLGADGVRALSSVLVGRRLALVELADNALQDEGALAVAKLLASCNRLEHLGLAGNGVSERAQRHVQHSLDEHPLLMRGHVFAARASLSLPAAGADSGAGPEVNLKWPEHERDRDHAQGSRRGREAVARGRRRVRVRAGEGA
eukprot:1806578-Rhodomonas_salina.1